jgi:hypothetical protein
MPAWKGPIGRLWNIFLVSLFIILGVPISLIVVFGDETFLRITLSVLLGVLMAGLYDVGRRDKHRNMICRETNLSLKDVGAAIRDSLMEARIPFEGPFVRPPPDGWNNWFEWEVRIPDSGMLIGVTTGGKRGRVVHIGPVDPYNATEVERLKGPVDKAFG